MTVYTTLPTDDENLEVTVIDDPDLVVLNINPAAVSGGGGGGSGTVTLINTGTGLTGGPISTTGTISIDETSDINFNSVTADFFGVQHFTAKARETITAGQPVYISGHSGNTPEVMVADFDDPAKMPAFGIASADIGNNNNGTISTYGDLKNVDTTGSTEGETWAVGDELFVNNAKLTNTRPSGSSEEIQKIAKIIRVHAQNGQMFLMGAGRSNDVPNLATQNVFIGNLGGVERRQLDTSDILEDASNLFYTDARVQTVIDTNTAGFITADSTDTLTNKSGNISQWTNDAGYLTTESDSQTLSFVSPDLSISNGNSVDLSALSTTSLPFSSITATPTTIAGYGITDAATQTVINNNANNRIITGSDTADNLEGEADFTWDGTNAVIDGTASDLTTPVLHLKTDNSNWNAPQLMCEDSNGKVFSQVGRHNTGLDTYQWNITLDPDNTHGRSGVTTFAGDYFVSFEKNYSDQSAIQMSQNIYGANDGFTIRVRDDFNNGGGNQYGSKPFIIDAQEIVFKNDNGDEYIFPADDGTANQVLATDGNGQLSFQDTSGLPPSTTPTLSADATQYFSGSASITNTVNYDKPVYYCIIKDSLGNEVIFDNEIAVDSDGNITWDWGTLAAGDYDLEIQAQDFGEGASAVGSITIAKANTQFQYWRLHNFTGRTDSLGRVMVSEFKLYDASSQGGTKYPTTMTSNTAPSPFVASADHAFSGYDAFKAFDDNANSGWWNLGSSQPYDDNIYIDLGSSINVKSMFVAPWQSNYQWTGVEIQASATGAWSGEEVTIATPTNVPLSGINIG